MNRRQLIGRVAALTAAVAVVPAARADAAPGHGPSCLCETPGCMGSTPEGRAWIERMAMEQAQARAEGYERGRAVAEARAESRALQDDTAYLQGKGQQ